MGAFASLTLNDSVPAAHTFGTGRISPEGVAAWYDRASGVPSLYPSIKMAIYEAQVTPAMKGLALDKMVNKINIKISVPVPDSIGMSDGGFVPGASQAYVCMVNLTASLPSRSTLLSRKDLLAYLKNYLATTDVTNAFEKIEFVS